MTYKLDSLSKKYRLNENKTFFDHNHNLDYQGISKKGKNIVQDYMEKTEFKNASSLKDITSQSQAFLQGAINNQDIKLPKEQSAYLVRKTKEKIWGSSNKDAQNLKMLINHIQTNYPNCLAKIMTNEKNQFQNFIFSSPNMRTLYQKFNDIVLLDSTYRTNKYRLPLFIIAGINENSKLFVIGFGLVLSEEAKNVKWILNELFTYLGSSPHILCTDSCSTIETVAKEILPDTIHLVCAWHVSQNIKKHLSGLSKI